MQLAIVAVVQYYSISIPPLWIAPLKRLNQEPEGNRVIFLYCFLPPPELKYGG